MEALIWLGVFVGMIVTDALWAFYIKTAADSRAFMAAASSIGIVLVGGFNTWVFVHDPWLLIPECLGSFIGTYFTVLWQKEKAP